MNSAIGNRQSAIGNRQSAIRNHKGVFRMARREEREGGIGIDLGFGDLFKGIGNFVDLISKMAEEGRGEVSETREFAGKGKLKDLKGVYGFSVKFGVGGAPTVQSFGNVKGTEKGPTVEEVREPIVDVFDEEKQIRVIAEMPGVEQEGIKVDLKDDILTINAESGDRKYSKEVLLPAKVVPDALSYSHKNGILEIKLSKE